MKCFCCEVELQRTMPDSYGNAFDGGGEIKFEFGYGSKYDYFRHAGWSDTPLDEMSRLQLLLQSQFIVGCICDECFAKKQHLLVGYRQPRQPDERQVVTVEEINGED